MPTKRFFRLLLLTIVLYMFANQTQVGWLYGIMSLLAGMLFVSWRLNKRAIHTVSSTREIELRDEYCEGETLEIGLRLTSSSPIAAKQLRLDELCPVADPEGEQFLQQWFLTSMNQLGDGSAEQEIEYEVELYKRGIFEFPAVEITSRFPFGLFKRSNYSENLVADSGLKILVYPQVRPLKRLPLLDRQPAAELVRPRAGNGNEFLALRDYRYGDSLRHIHWRSVARTGRLVSKEFADETVPGMALVIQRNNSIGVDDDDYGRSKHTPFETAVKITASLGDYAIRHGHPLTLLDPDAPQTQASDDMLLQYLARVEPDSELTFGEQIGRIEQTYVAAVLPHPTKDAVDGLIALKEEGREVLAILVGPTSSNSSFADQLAAFEIDSHNVEVGQDWAELIGGGPVISSQ